MDPKEARIRNRIAQQNYRAKIRRRMEVIEKSAAVRCFSVLLYFVINEWQMQSPP